MSIVQLHRHVVSAALLNLPWMQIRRMTISIYIIIIAFWRGEITKMECEQAVNSSLEVLCVLGTRWRSATHVRQIVVQLADKSGKSSSYLVPSLIVGLIYKEPLLEEPVDQADNGLERLAAVATNTDGNMGSMPMFALDEWSNLMNGFGAAGAADPMYVQKSWVVLMSRAQFVNTDLFGQYTDDSGIGPDLLDWQGLHQPPWWSDPCVIGWLLDVSDRFAVGPIAFKPPHLSASGRSSNTTRPLASSSGTCWFVVDTFYTLFSSLHRLPFTTTFYFTSKGMVVSDMKATPGLGDRYSDTTADLKLASGDDFVFHIPSYPLQASSSVTFVVSGDELMYRPVSRDMLIIDRFPSTNTPKDIDFVDPDIETGVVIKSFLEICLHQEYKSLDGPVSNAVVGFALKYESKIELDRIDEPSFVRCKRGRHRIVAGTGIRRWAWVFAVDEVGKGGAVRYVHSLVILLIAVIDNYTTA
jgi:hypothetical protein